MGWGWVGWGGVGWGGVGEGEGVDVSSEISDAYAKTKIEYIESTLDLSILHGLIGQHLRSGQTVNNRQVRRSHIGRGRDLQ